LPFAFFISSVSLRKAPIVRERLELRGMHRRRFLSLLALATGSLHAMDLRTFFQRAKDGPAAARMPSLFIGHGNPMNGILDNPFTQHLSDLGRRLERPKAVLVVSAHWLTPDATYVATSPKPATIHDFGGFPEELYAVQYPAPGAPVEARLAKESLQSIQVHEDHDMGLDHGAWTILKHIFPDADVPVFQLSIHWGLSPAEHYAIAKELQALRDKGILVIGSGNVVHNLRLVDWQGAGKGFAWAEEFDRFVADNVAKGDHQALVDYQRLGEVAKLAHPSNDHYLPLLYTLGASRPGEALAEVHTGLDMGSISMRSFILG
jgi:4,5-DOPA dioxygenase extradiol